MNAKTHKHYGKNDNRGNEVKQGTSRNNQETTRERFVSKRFLDLGGRWVFADLLPNHFHVASQRNRADEVLCVAHLFPNNFWPKTKGKPLDTNANKLGPKKMNKFMDKDDESKDNDDLQNDYKCCHIHNECIPLSDIEDLPPQCNIVVDKGGRE